VPLTGTFQLIVHKKDSLAGTALAGLEYPLLETQDEWVLHGFSYPNYLAELGPDAQSKIYEKSSVDLAMRDAFRKMRRFLMTTKGALRGRGDLADVGGRRLRGDPGRGRQLGRPRHHQEEPVRGRLGADFEQKRALPEHGRRPLFFCRPVDLEPLRSTRQ
jgi:hypothetical protein